MSQSRGRNHTLWPRLIQDVPYYPGEGQFNEDGTYYVPDLKEMYKWVLRGNMLTVMGMEFMVEKDASTWGWLIRRFPYPNVDDDDDDDDNPYGRIFFYSVGDEEDDD